MRARIIFRGLTLFTFDRSTEDATAGDTFNTLTAWLVTDARHDGMPLHKHTPYMRLIGRQHGSPRGQGRVITKTRVDSSVIVGMSNVAAGVTVDGSFLDYVPHADALYGSPERSLADVLASLTKWKRAVPIVIKNGRIRTGDFIAWDWYGKPPVQVAYMDTSFQGFGANEVIVDVGDDSDANDDDVKKFLAIDSSDGKVKSKWWPHTKGNESSEDIELNVVEVAFTNLAARRSSPVFWGIHFETLFDAAGYPRRTSPVFPPQFNAFQNAARLYDRAQWESDLGSMRAGQPFPFLIDINPNRDKLPKIADTGNPYILGGPPPARPGRLGSAFSATITGGMGGMSTGHDPDNVEICPHLRK